MWRTTASSSCPSGERTHLNPSRPMLGGVPQEWNRSLQYGPSQIVCVRLRLLQQLESPNSIYPNLLSSPSASRTTPGGGVAVLAGTVLAAAAIPGQAWCMTSSSRFEFFFVGATGKPLTNVVSVGIGGSFVGPLFGHTALQTDPEAAECAKGRQLRF